MSETACLENTKAEIRRRSDRFEAFFQAGDAAGLVDDYYVEEPVLSAPEVPLLTSRARIKDLFSGLMQQYSKCMLYNVDVRVSGNRAYELGSGMITPKDPDQPVQNARYLIVWRQVPDGWRVETDFFAFGKLGV